MSPLSRLRAKNAAAIAKGKAEAVIEQPAAHLDRPWCYAARNWGDRTSTWYVSQLPGDGGKDWGYTCKRPGTQIGLDNPIPLNRYWQRRFAADCRRTGATPRFYTATAPITSKVQEGQPGELGPSAYQFVRWSGRQDGIAIFRNEDGHDEVFAARRGGVAGWGLYWRGTAWEFCSSLTDIPRRA